MSESKFTPGPWRIGTPGPNGCYTIGTVRGLMTAMIAHSINETDQAVEAKANAKLIAAAPEMHGLLNDLSNWLVCEAITTPDDMAQSFTPFREQIDALLGRIKATA